MRGIDAPGIRDVDDLGDPEYKDKVGEFYSAFVSATKQIENYLGNSMFSGGAGANGFPEDQDAVWLSLWIAPSCRLMLQQKHEDRQLPFRICIVIASR